MADTTRPGLSARIAAWITAMLWRHAETKAGDARKPKKTAATKARPAASRGGARPTVLLVDDDRTNLLVLGSLLKAMRVSFAEATDGNEAIGMFCRLRPRLILMDVSMPTVDGNSATREIRRIEKDRRWKPCRIVGVTAHIEDRDRELCIGAGMDDHVGKPVSIPDLKDSIEKALKR